MFRLSGVTVDLNNKSSGIMLKNVSNNPIRKIRLDHNIFKNAAMPGGSARAVLVNGTIYGVIDSNSFLDNALQISSYGAGDVAWSNLTFSFGSGDCFYYEDNIFSAAYVVLDAGAGGRYCARYNDFVAYSGLHPWFDMHGNQPNGNTATMGAEIYGNVADTGTYGIGMFDQRGGKAVIFNNNGTTTGSVSAKVREEYADSMNPPAFNPEGQPQHVSDSYFWNNRKNNNNLISAYIDHDYFDRSLSIVNDPPLIVENITHFNHKPFFDGTIGVGCGTLAQRPVTCTAGVVYWNTNQSCTDLTGTTGKNPSSPISGTLHKCTAPNTWTAYYTPYIYPHPLRTATSDLTPPSVPANLTATPISSSQINLSWTASTDNVGVTGYKIFRCQGTGCTPTTQIGTSITNSFSNTGLTASTAYTYAVSAYDAIPNESGKSGTASATTQAFTGNIYYMALSPNH